jgi:hypothetical protein
MARIGERNGAYKDLVGNREGGRLLGITRRTLGDNIKMDLRAVRWWAWI